MPVPVIAIFDIGKTNKKIFLFNESYQIVYEKTEQLTETVDEDKDPCEDINSLKSFIQQAMLALENTNEFTIRAINFSAYGASFVYIDEGGKTIGHLYNYLKPYPPELLKKFYGTYGGEIQFCFQTASPVLGSLNSGMQLFRTKYDKPALFNQIKFALHLPQYLSFLISGKAFSEITSIGCHTNLWHFQNNDYHYWVKKENILEKLPPIAPSDMVVQPASAGSKFVVGVGLHDSSSALIPYLINFKDPFVLISTGTWAISLNPFNSNPLTKEELECDCLCFLQYMGTPVKASRLFAGHHHDAQVARIAEHFNQDSDHYHNVAYNSEILAKISDVSKKNPPGDSKSILRELPFANRDLSDFSDDQEAYHQLMYDLVIQQHTSTQLVLRGTSVKKIYVDGGFSNNSIYMNLLATIFPQMEVYGSSIPQATAIGAALAIHVAWNAEPFPNDIIALKRFHPTQV